MIKYRSDVVHLCRKKGFFSRGHSTSTHFSLGGGLLGKLNIPRIMADAFMIAFCRDVTRNVYHHSLTEKKLNNFRLYFDLDFVFDDFDHYEIASICTKVVSKFFEPQEDDGFQRLSCSVSLRRPWKQKTGMHIIFPYIILDDVRIALAIRSSFVQALKDWIMVYNWDDIIDSSVYFTGLRMNHSYKLDKDHEVIKESKYELKYVLGCATEEEIAKWSVMTEMRFTSIHPPYRERTELTPLRPEINLPRLVSDHEVWRDDFKLKKRLAPQFTSLMKQLHEKYATLGIKNVQTRGSISRIMIYDKSIKGRGHNYCMNIKDYHNNARIYFCIMDNKIFQRCFCQCKNKADCYKYVSDNKILLL